MAVIGKSNELAPRDRDERQPLGVLPSRGFWRRVETELPRTAWFLESGTLAIGCVASSFTADGIGAMLGGGVVAGAAATFATVLTVHLLCKGIVERLLRRAARRRRLRGLHRGPTGDAALLPGRISDDAARTNRDPPDAP